LFAVWPTGDSAAIEIKKALAAPGLPGYPRMRARAVADSAPRRLDLSPPRSTFVLTQGLLHLGRWHPDPLLELFSIH
jgi:hypothetical protein